MHLSIEKETIIDSIFSLKAGKSPSDDDICAEHFLHATGILVLCLADLLYSMLLYGFLPSQFLYGTIIPSTKDQLGNHGYMYNY